MDAAPYDEEDGGGDYYLNEPDKSKSTFTKHEGNVYCTDLTKDGLVAVSGDGNDQAFVWNVDTKDVLLECTGHKDSVTEVGFNHDDTLVVTADMAGLTQVWDWRERRLTWCNEGDDMHFLFWHHSANVIISGTKSGDVYMWQVPQGNCKVLPSHGFGSTCGKLLKDGKRLVVGYEDSLIKMWDLKTATVIWQTQQNNTKEIVALDVNFDETLLAVGQHGSLLKISDGKLVCDLDISQFEEVETVLFHPKSNILITGHMECVVVWDASRNVVRNYAKTNSMVTCLKWAGDDKFIAGIVDALVIVYDLKTVQEYCILTGHGDTILSLSIFPNNKFVLSGSEDKQAKIFEILPSED